MIPRTWRLLIGLGGFLLLNPQFGKPLENSVQFSGSLEAVTHHTISIRLPDGRVVDAGIPDNGELSAQSLFSKYRMGDLVPIKGHVAPVTRDDRDGYFPLRDEETGIGRNLVLEQIEFVRKPSSNNNSAGGSVHGMLARRASALVMQRVRDGLPREATT
jgi:hypothetical protein